MSFDTTNHLRAAVDDLVAEKLRSGEWVAAMHIGTRDEITPREIHYEGVRFVPATPLADLGGHFTITEGDDSPTPPPPWIDVNGVRYVPATPLADLAEEMARLILRCDADAVDSPLGRELADLAAEIRTLLDEADREPTR